MKDTGNRHDFCHTIHYIYFTGDEDASESKAQVSKAIRKLLGIYRNLPDEPAVVLSYSCGEMRSRSAEARLIYRKKARKRLLGTT